jgi:hypothetical protein
MTCVEFGSDRLREFVSAWGQFWPIAIDKTTRPYSIASTTVQQVISVLWATIAQTQQHVMD